MIIHPIPPLYDENSKVLILGSFPSVKSREAQFFYGHLQNRFWKVMAGVFDARVPEMISEKTIGIKAICLPSTSPANADWILDRLIDAWKVTSGFSERDETMTENSIKTDGNGLNPK